MACRTKSGGIPTWIYDETANDSDKTWTVPAGRKWDLKSIEVGILADATVGNRLLEWSISNALGNVIAIGINSGAIAAAAYGGMFICNSTNVAAAPVRRSLVNPANNNGVFQYDTLPSPCILPAGYVIRVWDLGAVSVAGDDMTVAIHYIDYPE